MGCCLPGVLSPCQEGVPGIPYPAWAALQGCTQPSPLLCLPLFVSSSASDTQCMQSQHPVENLSQQLSGGWLILNKRQDGFLSQPVWSHSDNIWLQFKWVGCRGYRRGHPAGSLKCPKSFWNQFHSLFLALVNVSQSPTCIYDPRLALPSSLISSRVWATAISVSLWCPPLAAWSCSRGNEMSFFENLCDKNIFISQGRSIPD